MAEKQILFRTEMVRAVLEGRKTVTRRVVKPQPPGGVKRLCQKDSTGVWRSPGENVWWEFRAPCQPGDILWVRETWGIVPDFMGAAPGPTYKADYLASELAALNEKHYRWCPSIHMPWEIARIFLRVTGVRAERLQDISGEDIRAEGVLGTHFQAPTRGAFADAWNRTIKPKDMAVYGWDANPWVWVIEFQRLDGKKKGAGL